MKSLKLVACGIGSKLKQTGAYIELIAENVTLKRLELGNNCLYDAGAEGLASALEKNKTLEILDLWGNRISAIGKGALIQALEKNKTLQGLRINGHIDTLYLRGAENHF